MGSLYWQVLLSEWRKLGKDGLTIPFLFGAQTYFAPNKYYNDINELIVAIAYNGEVDVYLTYCFDIKALILGLRTVTKQNIAGEYLLLDTGEKSKLFQTRFVSDLGSNLESVCGALSEQLQHHIDSGHYSINQTEWGTFTADDVTFINGCINTIN